MRASRDDVAEAARALGSSLDRPCVIALDGHSGVGKSTLGRALAQRLDAVVLDGDAVFSGGHAARGDDVFARIDRCLDWRAQREVLACLRRGESARFHAYDWETFDGRCEQAETVLVPRPFVVFEGVYSARPELADLVDLRVLVTVAPALRWTRLLARAGGVDAWVRQWIEAEDVYFAQLGGEAAFDLVVTGDT